MTWILIFSVATGILMGHFVLPLQVVSHLGIMTNIALSILILGVGIDLGKQKETWRTLRCMGLMVLCIPFLVAIGSLLGSILVGYLLHMPINESAAVGAGFGWYSLSGVLLAKIYSVQLGALAFLTNVARELMSFILIPLVAKYVGKYSAVAPGGATTMDTTLPIIARSTDADTAVIAFINGSILTTLVPILVPILINI